MLSLAFRSDRIWSEIEGMSSGMFVMGSEPVAREVPGIWEFGNVRGQLRPTSSDFWFSGQCSASVQGSGRIVFSTLKF